MSGNETAIDARFAAADRVLQQTGGSLLRPAAADPQIDRQSESASTATTEGVIEVLLEHAHPNDENSRQTFPDEDIEELAQSMREHGQKDPARAMPHPERPGEWLLLSSHKRKLALQRAGIKTIKLLPHAPVYGFDRYVLSTELNRHTAETALDQALSWQIQLRKGYVASLDEIASKLKLQKSQVSKIMAFTKLPETVLAEIRKHPRAFGPATGQLLSQLVGLTTEKELLDLVEGIIKGQISVRRLEKEVESRQRGQKSRRTKLNSRQYKLQAGGQEVGVLKDWDDGRVVLEIRLEDQKRREALVEMLKGEFANE
ncbi:ParB/RepB/Spo0J family partition protein [Piscinibacter gummiphilus]|uniref:ParB/RepB/Spo0J family partition protein n=1 Tax=Piscinibacter gummiphilus TaxID=946333 RepID=A0ABZ0D1U7_9BURK|nr:ParB/RepB/Spo0J family partition protein [Piscinibacter gummiphilus]WOB11214.1 ParB/RepB/Spo0J family partition protein [Piscinibacter gummiphilus]